MTRYALVADVGGTQMRAALVDSDGEVTHKRASLTLANRGRQDILERLLASLEGLASVAPPGSLVGVGLAIAGPTDPETGTVYSPPHIPCWDGYSPVAAVEERLSLKTFVANDATLAALAEHTYGAGRGRRHMVYLTLSTGIGGGIIVDGNLYTGNRGFAGEVGHITIDPDGPLCHCGNNGCLEALASGTAVARMARKRLDAGEASALTRHLEDEGGDVDARAVAEAAASGDGVAQEIMAEAGAYLGIGIAGLVNAFAPEIVVVGGGMSEGLDLMLPGIGREMERRTMGHQRGLVPVVKARLGDNVSLLGAAALVFGAAG